MAGALDRLPDNIRDAAEQVLEHFFNEDFPPAVDALTAAAKQLEDRALDDYKIAVNDTRVQMEIFAQYVLKLAEKYADTVTKDVEEIVALVEKDIVASAEKIISDISNRVDDLLDRLEQDGQTLFCATTGYIDNFQNQFASYFKKQDCSCVTSMLEDNPGLKQDCSCSSCYHIGDWYPSCSCNPWGMQFASGWYNRGKYQFLKCHLENAIEWEKWTVDQILSQLGIVQKAALSFRCLEDMMPGSTLDRDYFTSEYTNVSHTILVWRMPMAQQKLGKEKKLLLKGGNRQVSSSRGGLLVSAKDSCAGKSVSECVTEAMAELQTATEEMNEKSEEMEKAKSDFESQTQSWDKYLAGNMSNVAAELKGNVSNMALESKTMEKYLAGNVSLFESKVSNLGMTVVGSGEFNTVEECGWNGNSYMTWQHVTKTDKSRPTMVIHTLHIIAKKMLCLAIMWAMWYQGSHHI